jgi:hypothetical protein
VIGLLAISLAWGAPDLARSVVKIETTYQSWNTLSPWSKREPGTRTHHGVVVGERRILTTASAVRNGVLIRVEKRGGPEREQAQLVHVDPQLDLALITVDDEAFWEDMAPVPLAGRLPTRGSVDTLAWRQGQLQAADGRVVRIEVRSTRTGSIDYPALILTSDLPNGGSSEPVFMGRKLVGLTVAQSDETATVQGIDLIADYLGALDDDYRGFASFGASYQTLKSDAEAQWLGLDEPRGVLIRQVPAGTTACGVLQPRDVLLEVAGKPVDGNGKVDHDHYGSIEFTYMLSDDRLVGDELPILISRDGTERQLSLPLRAPPDPLVPGRRFEHTPPFVLVGGIAILELDRYYADAHGSRWEQKVGLRQRVWFDQYASQQSPDRRRALIIGTVLPDAYNLGYHRIRSRIVRSINGVEVDSLREASEALKNPVDGFIVLEIAGDLGTREIVLDAATLDEANARVRETYSIPMLERLPEDPAPLPCP